MSISQPSREIYSIDVPEVQNFQATFQYNFFVPDESVNDSGGVPQDVLTRPGGEIDSHFLQFSVTRAPRLVQFNFSQVKLAEVGNVVSEQQLRDNVFRTTGAQNGSLILNNLNKIVSEDDFASNNYVSVHFNDGEIDNKIYELVSGTMEQLTLEQPTDTNTSTYNAAQRLLPLITTPKISQKFLTQAMTQPAPAQKKFVMTWTEPSQPAPPTPLSSITHSLAGSILVSPVQQLKNVGINTQINSKFMLDLVDKAISDPTSTQASDLVNVRAYAKQTKQATNQRFSTTVSESDYKTDIPYIDAQRNSNSGHAQKYGSEIVGYIIDKVENNPDGSTTSHDPIVIDNPFATTSADYRIKFNASYTYTVRTIAQLTMQAIDSSTGDLATIKVLVTSKPSNKIIVSTLKLDVPPPPSDLNFVWNYETQQLMVVWAFPVTSERDIKQFQVFRRSSVHDCFELQKVYNFDDSVVPFPPAEVPDPAVVEVLTSPATYWIDDDFQNSVNFNSSKGFIYSVCTIDAHAQTSAYSAQFKVWFDPFKNKIQKQLISHGGAPKSYPNMYLEGDLFQNTINVSGPNSTVMKLYFNPQYYFVTDNQKGVRPVIATKQRGGSYQLQFMNLDNVNSQVLNVTIDDQTIIVPPATQKPVINFGAIHLTPGDRLSVK